MYFKLDWRYVPVLKYYKLHYINDDETRYHCVVNPIPISLDMLIVIRMKFSQTVFRFQQFFKENLADYYRTVFFDKEKVL